MPFIYQFGSLDAVLDRSKCKSNNDRQKISTKLVVEIIRSISWIIKFIFCNFNCKFRKMSLFNKYDKVNNLKSLKICTNYIFESNIFKFSKFVGILISPDHISLLIEKNSLSCVASIFFYFYFYFANKVDGF